MPENKVSVYSALKIYIFDVGPTPNVIRFFYVPASGNEFYFPAWSLVKIWLRITLSKYSDPKVCECQK